jgi:hypothetical protein
MSTKTRRLSFRLQGAAAAALTYLVAGVGAAQPAVPPAVVPPAPGQARLWFYRVFFPDDSGGMPAVAMNGSTIGYARAGYSFYRDVPAGSYQLSVASVGDEGNQTMNVALAPGSQVYIAVQSDPVYLADRPGSRQPTYGLGVEPPRIAAIHMSQMRLGSGY